METENYLLDDIERSQQEETRRRRENRSRRYRRTLMIGLGFLALIVLAAPSLISHTGVASTMLATRADQQGWVATADAIDVGWITPLSIRNLTLVGKERESKIQIERIDTSLTVLDLLRLDVQQIGEITVRGAEVDCTVFPGGSSIETDLTDLLTTDDSDASEPVRADIRVQNLKANIKDAQTKQRWVLDQSNLDVLIDGQRIEGDLAGVVEEPGGSGGAIQSHFVWHPVTNPNLAVPITPVSGHPDASNNPEWELSLKAESFPLSVMNLASCRFGQAAATMPDQFFGDTTGKVRLTGRPGGTMQAAIGDLRIRNLQLSHSAPEDASPKHWNNELATLDGELSLSGGWLFGHGLELTTDFASATLDGAFPTTMTLTGAEDNPLSWLQTLDGKARVDVDLAALDRAMPGLIPLRSDAQLVSGRLSGSIENTLPGAPAAETAIPAGASADPSSGRKSNLELRSDAIRARAGGRAVVIEPIKLTAMVSSENGALRADQFALSSSFASASGSGTLQRGDADLEIDFGRFYTMLRPIIDLSEGSLGGTASGRIRWNVRPGNQPDVETWQLRGDGEANNLLVTLPGGTRFKRAIVRGEVSAEGRWRGQSLQELTSADVTLHSTGVLAKAALVEPVQNPSADSMYAVRLSGDGRLENLAESLRPWLPESIRDAEGRIVGSATGQISRSKGSLSRADFDLYQPRIAYADQWFSQPNVTVHFQGVLDWPSGSLAAQDLTVVGEALSLAVQGDAGPEQTNLDVAWKLDLERLQQSVGASVARARPNPVQPASYRATREEPYRWSGQCQGKSKITGDGNQWTIDSTASATSLAIAAPRKAQPVPPGTPRLRGDGSDGDDQRLWYEPRLQVQGPIELNGETGAVKISELQVACDWFAGTLTGNLDRKDDQTSLVLQGPSKWKMDVVAARLSEMVGTRIEATGLHETPFKLKLKTHPVDPLTLALESELGWEACKVAGVSLGRATLPFSLSEDSLKIAPATIPIVSLAPNRSGIDSPRGGGAASSGGNLEFAAEVHYATTPATIRVKSGSKIDSLQITPETASSWLAYLAPLAAGATRIEGNLSATLDETLIVVGDPSASVVRGSLDIRRMQLASGPLANQLVLGLRQIKSLTQLASGKPAPAADGEKALIEMAPQTVDFSFENGVATHQRMYFQVDRAQIMTSGRVNLQQQLDMIAQIPLDARWLGNDLQGLAGETLTFPVTGTLSQPRLDLAAVRDVVTRLGSKAGAELIQNRLDSVIQKQLGSGLDQFNSGLEKILGF
ncbi:hypothetical protein FYK55_16895 [Roseiconus nitratireducens]|uniref:Uncharacterized protein n=1 Tax=Roseiconus nitratireducens TaxID=2605748 RepID=A0A5M6D546_9BACT|nr:hypothetical protein [Roseiconus nitratireducens]KAA5541876.1 hypothetical protein FYK55_16895 [Roseiconus nitratireducens]